MRRARATGCPGQRRPLPRRCLCAALALALAGCTPLVRNPVATVTTPAGAAALDRALDARPGNRVALTAAVLAYADRYMEKIAFALDSAARGVTDADLRSALQQTKVAYVTATFNAATGPDPVLAVRDLVVGAGLQRLVWDDPAREAQYPPAVLVPMREALAALEAQSLELGRRVASESSLAALRELVAAWRAANPRQDYVAFVRFEDVDTEAVVRAWEEDSRKGGFLAPVSDAVRQLELTKLTAERALFLLNHLPMLAEWNAEVLLLRSLASPELGGLVADSRRFTDAAAAVQARLDALPAHLAEERQALLRALFDGVARERALALEDLAARVQAEREALLAQVGGQARELQPLVESLALAAASLRDTSASLERLFPPAPDGTGENRGLADLQDVIDRATALTAELRALAGDVQPLLDAGRGPGLSGLDALLARHERRVFLFGVALLAIAAALALLVVRLARRGGAPQ